jgi:hypothetical protein
MWNWKTIYEDDTYAFYCDLDNIIDTAGDEEGLYASTECNMPPPERFGIWTSLFLKKKTAKKRYVSARKKRGFSTSSYEDYHYSLCLIEFDTGTMKYRVIPTTDYDEKNRQIGDSLLLDNFDPPLIDGVTVDWSSIRSKKTHLMIKTLYKLFSA